MVVLEVADLLRRPVRLGYSPQVRFRIRALATTVALLAGLVTAAVQSGPASAVLPSTACKISGPMAWRFPAPADPHAEPGEIRAFVQYQATNGGGTYAGVAVTWGPAVTFRVIRYSAGRVTVLATFTYTTQVNLYDDSVKVVGIDGQGYIIVRVQAAGSDASQQRYVGYRFDGAGHRWQLQASPLWTSYAPVGVTWQGVVVGWARYGRALHPPNVQTIKWTGTGQGHVQLIGPRSEVSPVATNRRGDILYSDEVVLTDGRTFSLGMLPGSYNFGWGAMKLTNDAAYGIVTPHGDDPFGVGWSYPSVPTAADGTRLAGRPVSYLVWLDAVGTYDDVVGEFPGNHDPDSGVRVLVTRTGKAYRLPPQFNQGRNFPPEPATVIDDYGRVVYTGTDGLPHMMSCPL